MKGLENKLWYPMPSLKVIRQRVKDKVCVFCGEKKQLSEMFIEEHPLRPDLVGKYPHVCKECHQEVHDYCVEGRLKKEMK